jgi:hypothetical protein
MIDNRLREKLAHILDSNIYIGKKEAHFPNTVNCFPLADALLESAELKIELVRPKWTIRKSFIQFMGGTLWEVRKDDRPKAFFVDELDGISYLAEKDSEGYRK